ncbi:DUF1622 domain-containing protein [Schnuerera sp. xch1]|uniref:DUF1622 domain-containing protein n=1 Tax=Schnuerera sp. xch1 TaxID=2874283 RepID=UPI001CBB4AF1|nr:DUF1622 domain-containing protein [Schnuerera sp. xch1]MBZ2175427.1 DUF1622 domain-containing protein [Schnuerera sp. xch1]
MNIELLLEKVIPYIAGLLEAIGVFVIVVASCKAIIKLIKFKFDLSNEDIKIELSMAMALALDFKLGAEILKTVTVRNLDEFFVLAAVTILRIIISFVIHWEVKSKERKDEINRAKDEISTYK